MLRRGFTLLLFLLLTFGGSVATGSVYFSHPYNPDSDNAYTSDDAAQQYGYTDYYWDGSFSITDFHWWGTYDCDCSQSDIAGYTVEIWSNNASWDGPDQLLYSEYFAGDAGATFVDFNDNFYYDIYSYGVDFATPFTPQAAGYIWFSVYAHPLFGDWYWALGAGDPFNSDWAMQPPNTWFSMTDYGGNGFAYEVSGCPTVPEPTTLSLLGLGLGLVGFALRRFRRR